MGFFMKTLRVALNSVVNTGALVTVTNLTCKAFGVKVDTTVRNAACAAAGTGIAILNENGRCPCKSCCDKKEEQPEPETENK